jgi:hypothetical protein
MRTAKQYGGRWQALRPDKFTYPLQVPVTGQV